jgi:hypothetical protein
MAIADEVQPSSQVQLNDAKSTLMTASKFKATKPAPTYEAPADTVPGSIDPAAKAELDRVSERVQIPKMHKGGIVTASGPKSNGGGVLRSLKPGEVVLPAHPDVHNFLMKKGISSLSAKSSGFQGRKGKDEYARAKNSKSEETPALPQKGQGK